MPDAPNRKFTFNDLRAARKSGRKVPMLTCYDFNTARLMQEAGVPALLVGDSAANVILGHSNTLSISLDFLIELTAAVRRGAPNCLVMADMPFGSHQASIPQGFKNVVRMVQLSGCDCVKIEAAVRNARLISRLSDAGVAMIAHLGLRPQTIGLSGGYQVKGKTATEAEQIVLGCRKMEKAGAAGILLEAVPPEISQAVVDSVQIPVIGCGAGPACHAHVFVTHDAIGWTEGNKPRFVPNLGDMAQPLMDCFRKYVRMVNEGKYPSVENLYEMPGEEKAAFIRAEKNQK
jgi:3-methyl-2-oxobutanoate hydroxymethyltransferase